MSAGGHNGDATCWDERAGGSATAVRPAVAAGEKLIWETCWASSVRVTEEVTVTVREKLYGVTAMCDETRRDDGNNRDAGDGNDREETARYRQG